jgi:hypothetical protein
MNTPKVLRVLSCKTSIPMVGALTVALASSGFANQSSAPRDRNLPDGCRMSEGQLICPDKGTLPSPGKPTMPRGVHPLSRPLDSGNVPSQAPPHPPSSAPGEPPPSKRDDSPIRSHRYVE